MASGSLEATVHDVGLQESCGLCSGTLQVQLGGAGGRRGGGGRWLIQYQICRLHTSLPKCFCRGQIEPSNQQTVMRTRDVERP